MQDLGLIEKYLDSGLSIIPILGDKRPAIPWTRYQEEVPMFKYLTKEFSDAPNIALVCGKVSGGIEVIDVDCKYDLTGTLMKDLLVDLKKQDKDILKKVVIQKTLNGGYHIIYRCSSIEGNQKLANRETTEQEKEVNPNEKVKVLIETRGEKGYILIAPSFGYEISKGDLLHIPRLTIQERELILSVCKSFNQVQKQDTLKELKRIQQNLKEVQKTGFKTIISPLDDYNDRGDVVQLLLSHGWTEVGRRGDRVALKRPGSSDTKYSAYYDETKKWFSVFSTSTEFETEKAYMPYAVFAVLECNGDYQQATVRLAELGYGESERVALENSKFDAEGNQLKPQNKVRQPSRWEDISFLDIKDEDLDPTPDNPLPFLSKPEDEREYFDMIAEKGVTQGLTTGVPSLDKHFRHKQGNFVVINGLDNVGKTYAFNYLMALSTLLHKWRYIVFCAENREAQVRRNLIQFATGKHYKSLSKEEREKWLEWSYDYYKFIKIDGIFNYRKVLVMSKHICDHYNIHAMFIDPYNSLDIDLTLEDSRVNEHQYHYKAYTYMRQFCKQFNVSLYLSMHPHTAASRNYDKDGFVKPPTKADTEGGQKTANRVDDFLTLHRYVDDSTRRNVSEWIVRKIKDTETGGKITSKEEHVKLRMQGGLQNFVDIKAEIDPVQEYHKGNLEQISMEFEKISKKEHYKELNSTPEELKQEKELEEKKQIEDFYSVSNNNFKPAEIDDDDFDFSMDNDSNPF